ncbi:unnamed protein product [Lactuca saligna]|uniref:Uncharacterized protein n=1 Tax=Lactuca saligna TaxID=75948 RepID=A0AA35Z5Y0_LACSI|nr:unnamed protein product [Lactuca saligna]
MPGTGSWSAASLPAEEHAVHGASDCIDTSAMIITYKEEITEDNDDTELAYSPDEGWRNGLYLLVKFGRFVESNEAVESHGSSDKISSDHTSSEKGYLSG